jgi:hypothetical protein
MIFLERIKKRLTMAVMPKDEIAPDKKVIGNVFLQFPKTSNVRKAIIKHGTGYFLFINFPEGLYNITAGGNYYRQEDFLLDTKAVQADQPFADIFLNPKANYPFPEGMTVLKGKIVDIDDRPLFEASITIEGMTESAISEDMGGFFIMFDNLDQDKNIILNINKEGYQFKQVPVILRKDMTTRVGTIKLDKI